MFEDVIDLIGTRALTQALIATAIALLALAVVLHIALKRPSQAVRIIRAVGSVRRAGYGRKRWRAIRRRVGAAGMATMSLLIAALFLLICWRIAKDAPEHAAAIIGVVAKGLPQFRPRRCCCENREDAISCSCKGKGVRRGKKSGQKRHRDEVGRAPKS